MNCPLCEEVCRCHQEPDSAALAQTMPGSAPHPLLTLDQEPQPATGPEIEAPVPQPEAEAWRGELSARLDRYRARRKIRPPRYPSLNLKFGPPEPFEYSTNTGREPACDSFEPQSHQALALNGMTLESPIAPPDFEAQPTERTAAPLETQPALHTSAKIIEFPRFSWGPPPPPPDQLAEPVSDVPRILEAPEIVPPPPALGGITIEAVEREEVERRPGIDIPLQSASLERRIAAGAVDGMIVAVASAMFDFIFWKVTAFRPPLIQLVGLGAGIPILLWFAYQYLLIVYAATTPGLRIAGLDLTRFDGTGTTRSLRRCRVLGSYLSAASLGMGYAWVFLDEDSLCWHDRITHTYLAPKQMPAN